GGNAQRSSVTSERRTFFPWHFRTVYRSTGPLPETLGSHDGIEHTTVMPQMQPAYETFSGEPCLSRSFSNATSSTAGMPCRRSPQRTNWLRLLPWNGPETDSRGSASGTGTEPLQYSRCLAHG